jgi:two-component system, chemotaxis family, chemotaxis protein CheY
MDTRQVLVVEDSEFVHQIYRVAFRRLGGWEVLHAHNGLEGLRCLDHARDVSLILLDINMPVLDGLRFLEQLRGMRNHKNTFVVVVSTESEDGRIRDALNLGAQAYLKKPFTLDQILALLNRVTPLLKGRQTFA